MKKIALLLAVLFCMTAVLVSCTPSNVDDVTPEKNGDEVTERADKEENEEVVPQVVNVAALKGPTSIGMIKMMDDAATADGDKYVYDFTVEAAADAITPKLIKGELDIAALPANLASVLYNKTEGEIVVLNVNTLGVLYIVENGNSVLMAEDLRGKTIYASGKGNTPEYALDYMLSACGLVPGKDVFVEFKAEHSECVSAILAEEDAVAMLPQPFVTTAQMQNENIRIALDVNKVWEEASGQKLVTGVTVARREFVEAYPDAVAEFMQNNAESVKFVNENVAEAAKLVEKFDIFKAVVAEKAIPYCSVSYIDGEEMKNVLSSYLTILSGQNSSAVGGKLPGDDFYYSAQ